MKWGRARPPSYIYVTLKIKVMKAEIYMHTDRLVYLQEELKDKVTILSQPDESNQQKISIDLTSDTDLIFIFHAGVRYGLDKMQAVFIK